ncbi:hypothetical protein LguiA_012169 [Lonicera macranthoides]
MYGRNNNNNKFAYAYSSADFLAHFDVPSNFPSAPLPPPPIVIPSNEFESVTAAVKLDFGYATSSGCSSYGSPSSLASYGTQTSELMMQRSVSSHSLHKHVNAFQQLVSSPTEFLDSDTSPVRKVFSTGDLQQNQGLGSPLSSNNNNESSSSIIEGMSRACRYSPDEKKERIERYRTKRNHRNFNKKIKYECRKTLADSRPRIRGRFARNEETEKAPQINTAHQWNNHDDEQVGGDIEEYHEEELDDDNNWVNFLNAFSANLIP